MANPSPTRDNEHERKQLFQDVWGDAPDEVRRRRARSVPEDDASVPDSLRLPSPADVRIDQLERQLRQLQDDVASLRRMTEEGLHEIRTTILRLAEAVQAATRSPRREA